MCGIIAKPLLYDVVDDKITYRGPDTTHRKIVNDYTFTFHRLSIMDTTHSGDQPFENEQIIVMCNGEIFNHKKLRANYAYPYVSHSDCEVLLPLLAKYSIPEVCTIIDAEFAFV